MVAWCIDLLEGFSQCKGIWTGHQKPKLHHPANLTQDIYWGEEQNGDYLWPGAETTNRGLSGREAFRSFLEHIQWASGKCIVWPLILSHKGGDFHVSGVPGQARGTVFFPWPWSLSWGQVRGPVFFPQSLCPTFPQCVYSPLGTHWGHFLANLFCIFCFGLAILGWQMLSQCCHWMTTQQFTY